MGALVSCLALETASCFTAMTCRCFTSLLGLSTSMSTRIAYALIFLANGILSWLALSGWAIKYLQEISRGYLEIDCPEGYCYGVLAVHRLCFALFLFHIIFAILLKNVHSTRSRFASLHNGWWGPKILAWLAMIVMTFFIPNGFFVFWGNYVAPVGAALIILFQLAVLVDCIHEWSERCLYSYEIEGSSAWLYALIGTTLGSLAFSLTVTVLMYVFFGQEGCRLNQFFISFNLVLMAIACGLAIHPSIQEANSRSGLAQAGMVAAYTTYLVASAIVSEPILEGEDGHCNPVSKNRSTKTVSVILGALFTLLAVAYSTARTAGNVDRFTRQSGYVPLETEEDREQRARILKEAYESGAIPASELNGNDAENDDEQDGCVYPYSAFHLILALACMYTAMLLTDWSTMQREPSDVYRIGQSYVAVWIRIISSWICLAMYAWTLIAPVLFPDRFDWM